MLKIWIISVLIKAVAYKKKCISSLDLSLDLSSAIALSKKSRGSLKIEFSLRADKPYRAR